MEPKEAIIRLELDRHIRLLWQDFRVVQECGALSDLEAEIWAAITAHPAIQRKLD